MEVRLQRSKFSNVCDALEDERAMSANVTIRSDLLIALQRRIGTWKVSQARAARRLKVTQPRLNELLSARISKFSLDALVEMAIRTGIRVSLQIGKAA